MRLLIRRLLVVSSVVSLTAFAVNVSPPAGVLRIDIPTDSTRLNGVPFEPFSSDVAAVFGSQLDAAASAAAADQVSKWDAAAQSYVTAFRADNTGDSTKDGNWFVDDTAWTPSTMTFAVGDGFFIANNGPATSVFLTGRVPLAASHTVTFVQGLSLFAPAYPVTALITDVAPELPDAHGAVTSASADRILPGSGTTFSWLYEEAGNSLTGIWHDENNSVSAQRLQLGSGYWYQRVPASSLDWVTQSPYSTESFSAASSGLDITGVNVDTPAGTVSLSLSVTGQSGESITVLAQDIVEEGSFDAETGWTVLADNIATNGATTLTWVDTAFVSDSATATGPIARVYAIGRADVDSDGDGLNDSVEALVYGTLADSADSDADGLPDAWEIAAGLDAQVANANEDSDGDGYSNGDEYLNGTNPTAVPTPPTVNCHWPRTTTFATREDTVKLLLNMTGGGGITNKREAAKMEYDPSYIPNQIGVVERIDAVLDGNVVATWVNTDVKGVAHPAIAVPVSTLAEGQYELYMQARWSMDEHPDTPVGKGRTPNIALTIDRQPPVAPDISAMTVENAAFDGTTVTTTSDTFTLHLPVASDITSVVFSDHPRGHCFVAYPNWTIDNDQLTAVVTRIKPGATTLTISCRDAAHNAVDVSVNLERTVTSGGQGGGQ